MALAIASVPVLTGKVAEQFEAQAKKYEQGVLMVKKILAKAKLEEE